MPNFKIEKINHVGVPIADRAASIGFYRDLLGLEVIPHQIDGNTLVWTRALDGGMVHLIEPRDPDAPLDLADGRYHVALQVDDFDAALDTVTQAGLEITSGPGERHNGQRYFFVQDPDGNRIEIASAGYTKESNRVVDELGYTSGADGSQV